MRKPFYLHRRGRYWYVQYRDPVTGKISSSISTEMTNKAAAEKVALREAARLAALSEFPAMSLGQWGDKFFIDRCPRVTRLRIEGKKISDRYIRNCRALWLHYIKDDPVCGIQMAAVRRAHCLAFRERLVEKVGKSRTAQTSWAVFRLICREGYYHGLSDHDPCVGIGQIAYEEKTRAVLSLSQIKAVLDPVPWCGSIYYEPTVCAALTGMRKGEVRALQWSDLDSKSGVIRVVHNLPGSAGAGGETSPKWGKGRVTVYPGKLQDLLEPRRSDGYVFSYRDGPIGGERWLITFKLVCAKLGIEGATLHSLRHSIHTALLSSGVDPGLLRGSFGWSGSQVQEGYTHRELYNYKPQADAVDLLFGEE